jgi:hypothetical protein
MTHTLHRTGDLQSIKEDFPMLAHVARGFNDQGASPRLKQIALTMTKHTDLHFGDCKVGNKYQMDPTEIMDKLSVGCQVVFKDKESLIACMKELKEKDQGISIVVSGLFDEVFDCCNKAGIKPPRSGSGELNGMAIAEQIGAQIFIDTWARANPGDPERAVALARKAAIVSHDGIAVEAAVHLAATWGRWLRSEQISSFVPE